MRHGVFMTEIGRKDIGNVQGPMDVVFTPDFEIHYEFYFQALNNGGAMGDGELAVLPNEIDGVVQEILTQGLVFQALHQHFVGENPQIFHIHLRGKDNDPVHLAAKFRNVVAKTGTPLPQQKPKNPTSQLDHQRLAQIIGGDAHIGGGGIVHAMVPRRNSVKLGGEIVNPYLEIMSHIAFKPLDGAGGLP